MVKGCLHVDIDRGQDDDGALRIQQEIKGLQVPGVQITSVSEWPVSVDLEAQTIFQLSETEGTVRRITGVAQVLLYLGKAALASIPQPEDGE